VGASGAVMLKCIDFSLLATRSSLLAHGCKVAEKREARSEERINT
jgi:hypothetical protein